MISDLLRKLAAEGSIVISVRTHPGARKAGIKEVMADGSLKIAVKSAPEAGKANTELVKILAEEFGVEKNGVEILSGQGVRLKIIRMNRKSGR